MVVISIVLAGALLLALLAYGYAIPGARLFGRVHTQSRTKAKVIALTFDDGPNEPYTSSLLDILKLYSAKATFFTVGPNVEQYPETVHRLVAEGHIIANHTYSHNANHALLNSGADIARAQEAIARIAGFRPRLYRPPHGKKTPWEMRCLRKTGLEVVAWSVAANEAHRWLSFGRPDPGVLARHIIRKTKPGAVILLHDGYGTEHDNHNADKSLTVAVLPLVLDGLSEKGYRFVTVSELFNLPAYD
jgi:peptidoglycan/xylan/chitin deacetylase (PgdA/CDA1 family)